MGSVYIKLFIEAIKVSLLNASPRELAHLLEGNSLNWQLLNQKATFHAITPVLFDAFNQVDDKLIDSQLFAHLKHESIQQSFFNLSAARETVQLLTFLAQHQIRAIPFKGIVFVHELYGKKSIREGSDIDILVRKKDAKKALSLLTTQGDYTFLLDEKVLKNYTNDELIDQLITTRGYHEVGLEHRQSQIHIDFHWEPYEDFYQYQLPEAILFHELTNRPFFNTFCPLPTKEAIFWMLLIHHGGRDVWIRLKYICDLLLFYETYKAEINWQKIVADAEKFKLKRVLITAFYLLEKHFDITAPNAIKKQFSVDKNLRANYLNILDYWGLAQNRNHSFIAKLKSYGLYFALQDDDFSYRRHLKHSFLKRSYPTPLEIEPRIITFPARYVFLNFLGKLATAFALYVGWKER